MSHTPDVFSKKLTAGSLIITTPEPPDPAVTGVKGGLPISVPPPPPPELAVPPGFGESTGSEPGAPPPAPP
jgi:hypothetical protein